MSPVPRFLKIIFNAEKILEISYSFDSDFLLNKDMCMLYNSIHPCIVLLNIKHSSIDHLSFEKLWLGTHIQIITRLNMLVGSQPSPNMVQWCYSNSSFCFKIPVFYIDNCIFCTFENKIVFKLRSHTWIKHSE